MTNSSGSGRAQRRTLPQINAGAYISPRDLAALASLQQTPLLPKLVQVVTAIEVLSPTNKLSSDGRVEYEKKRRAVLSSVTSLIEIDLLRAGEPMRMEPLPQADYRIVVSRGWEHPEASLHAFSLREVIPVVTVPPQWNEKEASLSVGELLAQVYDRARYDLRVDYKAPPPEPALSADDAAWVEALLRGKGLRPADAER